MPQLDGLRAIAVLAVIAQHTTRFSASTGFSLGTAGVWLFYVLSGFLITGILLRCREKVKTQRFGRLKAWRAFWMRRALRIFPLYYVALALAVVLAIGPAREAWPWYATYLQNVRIAMQGRWPIALGHFWSLAVEEQFYAIWPVACLLLPRYHILRLAVMGVVAAPLWRFAVIRVTSSMASSVVLLPACLDGLGLGAILAITRRTPPLSVLKCGILLEMIAVALKFLGMGWSLNFTLERFAFSLIAWWTVARAASGFSGRCGQLLSSAPLAYLGRISYGIYVIHAVLPIAIEKTGHHLGTSFGFPTEPGLGQFFCVTVASIALASLSWYVLERPANRLKRFFPYVVSERESVGSKLSLAPSSQRLELGVRLPETT